MPYLGPQFEPGQSLIRVHSGERDWLYAERTRAIRGFADLDFQRERQSGKVPFSWSCALHVYRRAEDGCLEASIVLALKCSKKRYVRKLRCPNHYASSEGSWLWLRRSAKRR